MRQVVVEGVVGSEQSVDGETRGGFFGHGGVRVAPGNERTQNAREAAADIVDPRTNRIETEFEGGQNAVVADRAGDELVDRGADGFEIAAVAALNEAAREPGRHFGPVAVAPDGFLVPEIFQQHQIGAVLVQRFEHRRHLPVVAVAFRRPVAGHHVGHKHERGSKRRTRQGFCRAADRTRGRNGFHPREGHSGADAPEDIASGDAGLAAFRDARLVLSYAKFGVCLFKMSNKMIGQGA